MFIVRKRLWARLENSLIHGTLGKWLADAQIGEKVQTKIQKKKAAE